MLLATGIPAALSLRTYSEFLSILRKLKSGFFISFSSSALVVVCGSCWAGGRCALSEPGGNEPLTPGLRVAGCAIGAATGVDSGAVVTG